MTHHTLLMNRTKQSRQLMQEAQRLLPGGVNSPVRAFKAVGGPPLFIKRGSGSRIWDVDGNEYIDYVGSWGPLILGHAPAVVIEAIGQTAAEGTTFGAPTAREVELAAMLTAAFPGLDMVRLVNSGTEATMSAVRLARAYTRRDLIVKFEGCYHGHADFLLVKAGSGVATLGLPDSPGVPAEAARHTITVPFNDPQALGEVFERYPGQIAAVIMEPIAGNMGVVPPQPDFLAGVRRLCTANGALFVCDEVMTGFRVAYGGAQTLYGIQPDLTCLGKIIGGGLPVGAYGGRRELMEMVAPLGPVYQAGTLSGNPLAVAAGIATLRELQRPDVYQQLEARSAALAQGLADGARSFGIPVTVQRVGSMLTAFFNDGPVSDYTSAKRSNTATYARFFWAMLERGIYLAPSQFEAAFLSLAHSEEDIEQTLAAAEDALAEVRGT